eukprot:TRINITY_DN598_c7_g1_i1.p1 TRINITY_DN598_c7_g1~~TRINITY_DN598_c7_g1_i1.p1  ORF type:complete len:462 (-),score=166.16 TRINITY_DN598_c7_g1_i1:44-1429(-)
MFGWGSSSSSLEGQPCILPELPSPQSATDYVNLVDETLSLVLRLDSETPQTSDWSSVPFKSFYGPDNIFLYDKPVTPTPASPDSKEGASTISTVKVVAQTMPCSVLEMYTCLATEDVTEIQKLEKILLSFEIISRPLPNTSVIRTRISAPFPVTNREAVAFRTVHRLHDGGFIMFGQSINHPDCLTCGNFVRATGLIAVIVRPIQGEPDICQLTRIVRIDPKGMIPGWIVNQAKKKAAGWACDLRRFIEGEKHTREFKASMVAKQVDLEKLDTINSITGEIISNKSATTEPTEEEVRIGSSSSGSMRQEEKRLEQLEKQEKELRREIKEERVQLEKRKEEEEEEEDVFYDLDGGNEELKGMLVEIGMALKRVEGNEKKYMEQMTVLEEMLKEMRVRNGGGSGVSVMEEEEERGGRSGAGEREKREGEGGVGVMDLSWGSWAVLFAWPVVALGVYEFLRRRR